MISKNKYSIKKITLSFKFQMDQGGGSRGGADGIAFSITPKDRNDMNPQIGGSIGAGIGGFAIELDTYQNNNLGDPDGNHIAITKDLGTKPTHLKIASNISSDLNDGRAKHLEVVIDSGVVSVKLDGEVVISRFSIPNFQPFEGHLVFTSSTGGGYNRHQVWDITQKIN